MSTSRSLRDHGLAPCGTPTGAPTWERAESIDGTDPICPNCGGWLCEIRVPVRHPLMPGGCGTARYLGCPACPYASPTIVTSDQPAPSDGS